MSCGWRNRLVLSARDLIGFSLGVNPVGIVGLGGYGVSTTL